MLSSLSLTDALRTNRTQWRYGCVTGVLDFIRRYRPKEVKKNRYEYHRREGATAPYFFQRRAPRPRYQESFSPRRKACGPIP